MTRRKASKKPAVPETTAEAVAESTKDQATELEPTADEPTAVEAGPVEPAEAEPTAEEKAPAEPTAEPTEPEKAKKPSTRRRRRRKATPPTEGESAAEEPVEAEPEEKPATAPEKEAEKPPAKRRRRRKATPPDEAEAAAEEPTEPEPAVTAPLAEAAAEELPEPEPAATGEPPQAEAPAEELAEPEPIAEAPAAPAPGEISFIDLEGLSPDEMARILKQRARDLAQLPPTEEEGEVIEVVVFALGEETYAVEAAFVEGIHVLAGLTRVPCTPDFVVGVVNLRGRILSVIDIHRFLGLERTEIDDRTQVIAVNAAGLEVGILANYVHTVRPLALTELVPALPTTARATADYTRGVAADMLVLLDLEALLSDKRIIVREEVVL